MIPLSAIVLLYFGVLYLFQLTQIYLLFRDHSEKIHLKEKLPMVSILIAVRNEEKGIIDCLKSLEKLDWPKTNIEILVGNDASEDLTAEVVEQFMKGKPTFRLVHIENNLGLAKGKANVLAQLARVAKGEFFCITDADIRVPETWVKGLVGAWEPGYGTVNGVTIAEKGNAFAGFQAMDWLYAFSQVRVITRSGIPVTAVGNNMLISREAYISTGGYENIPFSITEDFELFRQTLKKGWKYKNLLQPEVLSRTVPLKTLGQFFHQRKRWMTGAMQLPWFLILILGWQGFILPFILLAIWINVKLLWLWFFKILLDSIFTSKGIKKVGQTFSIRNFMIHALGTPFLAFAQIAYSMFPGKIDWKGRKY